MSIRAVNTSSRMAAVPDSIVKEVIDSYVAQYGWPPAPTGELLKNMARASMDLWAERAWAATTLMGMRSGELRGKQA